MQLIPIRILTSVRTLQSKGVGKQLLIPEKIFWIRGPIRNVELWFIWLIVSKWERLKRKLIVSWSFRWISYCISFISLLNCFNVWPEGSRTWCFVLLHTLQKQAPGPLIFHIHSTHSGAYLNTFEGVSGFSHPYPIYRNNCSSWKRSPGTIRELSWRIWKSFCFLWKAHVWFFVRIQASLQNSSQNPINITVKSLSSAAKSYP